MKLSAMMTVFNDCEVLDASIKSVKDNVDQLVICEGSYKERHKDGVPARSTDKTIDICKQYADGKRVLFFQANEQSDPQQRNFCLEKIKQSNSDGWFLIVDSDEVYQQNTFPFIRQLCSKSGNIHAVYFQSMTFVNDLEHYTIQHFPRLFKITTECTFINDNQMYWKDIPWCPPYVVMMNNIKYLHYSFTKGIKKFEEKKKWWMGRGLITDYGWRVNEKGLIEDPEHHKIYLYSGKHCDIIEKRLLTQKG